MTISFETYQHMMNVATMTLSFDHPEWSADKLEDRAHERVTQYCELMGISEVEDPEDLGEVHCFFETEDEDYEVGYDPYAGCFTDDV